MKRVTCTSCGAEHRPLNYHKNSRCPPCATLAHAAMNRAINIVYHAIKRGELRPAREFTCTDCYRLASQYDHRDYAQPLKVEPVCFVCNSRRGPAAPFNKFHSQLPVS